MRFLRLRRWGIPNLVNLLISPNHGSDNYPRRDAADGASALRLSEQPLLRILNADQLQTCNFGVGTHKLAFEYEAVALREEAEGIEIVGLAPLMILDCEHIGILRGASRQIIIVILAHDCRLNSMHVIGHPCRAGLEVAVEGHEGHRVVRERCCEIAIGVVCKANVVKNLAVRKIFKIAIKRCSLTYEKTGGNSVIPIVAEPVVSITKPEI